MTTLEFALGTVKSPRLADGSVPTSYQKYGQLVAITSPGGSPTTSLCIQPTALLCDRLSSRSITNMLIRLAELPCNHKWPRLIVRGTVLPVAFRFGPQPLCPIGDVPARQPTSLSHWHPHPGAGTSIQLLAVSFSHQYLYWCEVPDWRIPSARNQSGFLKAGWMTQSAAS
jgi:hypothetical protein